MIIIGIDPGFNGGIAKIKDGKIECYPMPVIGSGVDRQVDINALMPIVVKKYGSSIYVEKAQAMPKNGAVGMFRYGREYGRILGMMETVKIPIRSISPKDWQKIAYAGISASGKDRSIIACKRLYPGVSLLPTPRCSTPHTGMADALLIAHYGRVIHGL